VRRTHCLSLSKRLRIPCLIVAAICSLACDDLPGPPVRGRPVGFSGIEGAVEVTATAAPVALMAESPLTYTLRLKGPPTLATLPVPELAKLNRFNERFAIRLLGQSWLPKEQTREFQFELRPRTANVNAIPPFSFSFWLRGKIPPEAGFETRSTKSIALQVAPPPQTPVRSLPIEGASEPRPEHEPRFDFSAQVLATPPVPYKLPYGALAAIALTPPLLLVARALRWRARRIQIGAACVRVRELARRLSDIVPDSDESAAKLRAILDAEPASRFEQAGSGQHPGQCGCPEFLTACRAYLYGGAQQESLLRVLTEARNLAARGGRAGW
jgi:hypothetical protein